MIFEDFTYHSINVDEMKTSLEEFKRQIAKRSLCPYGSNMIPYTKTLIPM